MVLVSRKKKTAVFRQYVAAETAVPVISCCACLEKDQEVDFFFAGVARSKSVRTPDDGMGPSVDEFFTLSLGGMVTLLNTSGHPLYPGDLIEWCALACCHPRAAAPPRRRAAALQQALFSQDLCFRRVVQECYRKPTSTAGSAKDCGPGRERLFAKDHGEGAELQQAGRNLRPAAPTVSGWDRTAC